MNLRQRRFDSRMAAITRIGETSKGYRYLQYSIDWLIDYLVLVLEMLWVLMMSILTLILMQIMRVALIISLYGIIILLLYLVLAS